MDINSYYQQPIVINDIVLTSMFPGEDPTKLQPYTPGVYIGKVTWVNKTRVGIKIINKDHKSTSRDGYTSIKRPISEVIKAPPEVLI